MPEPQKLAYDEHDVQHAWDSTSLKNAAKCLRYYQYKMIDGWQPKVKSVHLLFGGWYATALEHYHKYRANGVDYETAVRNIVREALINTWKFETDDEGKRIDDSGKPWESDHSSKTRENLIRTLVWYLEQFKEDSLSTYITTEGAPAVEFSFALAVDNDILLSGHIDRLATDEHGHIYITDQKTTGSTLSPYYYKGFKPDTQMYLYPFAGQMIYEIPIKGVIIDAAQIVIGFSKFGRAPIMHTQEELNEWYDETMDLIQYTQHKTRERHFPRNYSSCGNYGGCEFRDICAKPLTIRKNFLEADFKKEERWNPLKTR